MTKKRVLVEFGIGTSLRRIDYTEAATRAVRGALWHNSVNISKLAAISLTVRLRSPSQVAGTP